MPNANLSRARSARNDEFYTQYADIEREMRAYLDHNEDVFRDKVILLPCDDPEWSNFTRFFAQNFERFGIKKLISTSYAPSSRYAGSTDDAQSTDPRVNRFKEGTHGRKYTLSRDVNGDAKIDILDLEWEYLEGDGDFRSAEVTRLRDEADIIITNPPFSLFREYMAWLQSGDVKFACIANKNCITYSEIFPLIKNNKLWGGKTSFSTDIVFIAPSEINPEDYPASALKNVDGQYFLRSPSIWLTNIDHGRRHEPLQLMTMADNLRFGRGVKGKAAYDVYDNYDAIEVPFTASIPSDYDGVMGVPISFLDKYCPEQFEIIGSFNAGSHGTEVGARETDTMIGGKIKQWNGPVVGMQPLYKRILIKHKNPSTRN